MNISVGDWVVVMNSDLVPIEENASTWDGIPCYVQEILSNKVAILDSPLKPCWGRPPVQDAPLSQLIKVNKEDAEEYIRAVKSHDTYQRTRNH